MNPKECILKHPTVFSCESCEYVCGNKKDYNKHIFTQKHKNRTNPNPNLGAIKVFSCTYCKRTYKHASTLSTHKKTCTYKNTEMFMDDKVENSTNEVNHDNLNTTNVNMQAHDVSSQDSDVGKNLSTILVRLRRRDDKYNCETT